MVDKLTDDFELLDVDHDGELSDIAVDLLVLAQQLIEAKVRLEQMTKNGWMDMAKARYIMGSTSISALQLPKADDSETTIEPIRTVDKQEYVSENGVKYSYYTLNHHTSQGTPTKPASNENFGLRQRKQSSKIDEDTIEKKGSGVEDIKKIDATTTDKKDAATDNKEKVDKPTPKKNMNEPLRWFSAMPPASLKSSQKCFQSALDIVVEIANIQSEIMGMENKMRFLKRKIKQQKKVQQLKTEITAS